MGIIKGWRPSQTSSGYYHIYPFGVKTLKFIRQKSIYKPYKIMLHDSGSGTGYKLNDFKTKKLAKEYAIKYMRSHPKG